jgi:hypothetical protein
MLKRASYTILFFIITILGQHFSVTGRFCQIMSCIFLLEYELRCAKCKNGANMFLFLFTHVLIGLVELILSIYFLLFFDQFSGLKS